MEAEASPQAVKSRVRVRGVAAVALWGAEEEAMEVNRMVPPDTVMTDRVSAAAPSHSLLEKEVDAYILKAPAPAPAIVRSHFADLRRLFVLVDDPSSPDPAQRAKGALRYPPSPRHLGRVGTLTSCFRFYEASRMRRTRVYSPWCWGGCRRACHTWERIHKVTCKACLRY